MSLRQSDAPLTVGRAQDLALECLSVHGQPS
jgi:hypothetical protein